MKTLTIFTPTYNRAQTLVRTFQSLCRQTCKDFEWLIIDDGSTDDTQAQVAEWTAKADFTIRYIYQENQGMHSAHNTAYRNIHTEINTCIDSDDWMPENAVKTIIEFWERNRDEKYAGFAGLDITPENAVIGTVFPDGMTEMTLTGYYAAGGKGDKKLVYRTDVIKQYPEYPIFEGEKYVGLAYKYMLIDQDYKLLALNKPLVVVDYQPDGSSNTMMRQYWNNPQGFAFYRKTEMRVAPTLKRKFISCIHYVSSSLIAHNSNLIKESPQKLLTILATLPGVILYIYIKKKVKN